MKLFDAEWAPNPRRVRVFLAEKGLEIERVRVDIAGGEHFRPDYVAINPQRQMPALLLDDGTLIDDSHAICRYFEAVQPDPPLFGTDPREIGLIEAWLRRIEHDCLQAVVLAFRNRASAFKDRAVSGQWPAIPQIPDLIERGRTMWAAFADVLDAHLAERDYLVSDTFSMADISGLVAIDFGIATRLPDPRADHPAIARWHQRVSARPSAAA